MMGGAATRRAKQPADAASGQAATKPAAGEQPSDLLQGVQDANRRVQGREVQRLQKIYQGGKGMGGVGIGGAF